MSILSTLNKLTGKSDKNVLAALNSLTGKTADDIEEAMGNLGSGGGAQIEKYSKVAMGLVYNPEDWVGSSIYSHEHINSDLYSAITLNSQPLIKLYQPSEDPHSPAFSIYDSLYNRPASFPVGAILSTSGIAPIHSVNPDAEENKLLPPYIFKVNDDGIVLSYRSWDLDRDPIYYEAPYQNTQRYFNIIVPDIAEDEIAVYGYYIDD